MKIAIGCDHGGDNLRPIIAEYLQELGHDVIEYSPKSGEHRLPSIWENGGRRCCRQQSRSRYFDLRNWCRHIDCCQ